MILTAATLRKHRACPEQISRFIELFGEAVDVTPDLCKKHANEFQWSWAYYYLLRRSAKCEYNITAQMMHEILHFSYPQCHAVAFALAYNYDQKKLRVKTILARIITVIFITGVVAAIRIYCGAST